MSQISGPAAPALNGAAPEPRATGPAADLTAQDRQRLRDVAQELEATFLAEMLKQARFGEARCAFGGGAGEEQFASILRQQHAEALVANGGIGLAESIFHALAARSGDPGHDT
ncbi:hypothetical protein HKCCE3408_12340 [Rhodobacterales bacterium HKCCE3408]|nr:hypothetical protein [Rhodobacterales bacterium HKCCE3408]